MRLACGDGVGWRGKSIEVGIAVDTDNNRLIIIADNGGGIGGCKGNRCY